MWNRKTWAPSCTNEQGNCVLANRLLPMWIRKIERTCDPASSSNCFTQSSIIALLSKSSPPVTDSKPLTVSLVCCLSLSKVSATCVLSFGAFCFPFCFLPLKSGNPIPRPRTPDGEGAASCVVSAQSSLLCQSTRTTQAKTTRGGASICIASEMAQHRLLVFEINIFDTGRGSVQQNSTHDPFKITFFIFWRLRCEFVPPRFRGIRLRWSTDKPYRLLTSHQPPYLR